MTSLLFVYIVFGPILQILIIYYEDMLFVCRIYCYTCHSQII